MKDNTLLYVGLGLAAVYVFSKKKTAIPVSNHPVNTVLPYSPVNQPQSIATTLIPAITSIINKIKGTAPAATNVSNGYNPDGTITLPDQTQTSVNQLPIDTSWMNNIFPINATTLPNNGSSSPTGYDLATDTDSEDQAYYQNQS